MADIDGDRASERVDSESCPGLGPTVNTQTCVFVKPCGFDRGTRRVWVRQQRRVVTAARRGREKRTKKREKNYTVMKQKKKKRETKKKEIS